MIEATLKQPLSENAAIEIPGLYSQTIRDMATIRNKVGHLETLSRDLLNAHLGPSFIFNHLDTMNASPNWGHYTKRPKSYGKVLLCISAP